VVEGLSLRVTRLKGAGGVTWYVPNGDIRKLANSSRGWVETSVDVPVTIGCAEDLDGVEDLLLEAARALTRRPELLPVCPDPPRVDGLVEATAEALKIRVTLLTTTARAGEVERALRQALVRALLHAGLWPATDPAPPAPSSPPRA
jgi:small-conductance mechanosensitive channel